MSGDQNGVDGDAFTLEESVFSRSRRHFAQIPQSQIFRVSAATRRAVTVAISYRLGSYRNTTRRTERFERTPYEFAEVGANVLRAKISRPLQNAIAALAEGKGPPFLIIRNLLPVPIGFPLDEYKFRQIAGGDYDHVTTRAQRRMRWIDTVLGGLLELLGTEPMARYAAQHGTRCAVDLSTRPDVQEAFDALSPDMPLRFHQETVDRALPSGKATRTDTALYVAYGAIRNVRRIPILLLTVDSVLSTLRTQLRDFLTLKERLEFSEDRSPEYLDKLYQDTLGELKRPLFKKDIPRLTGFVLNIPEPSKPGSILAAYRGANALSFDSSLVWVAAPANTPGKEAINKLRHAIERASWDDPAQIYNIELRRHDILLVDNLRAMLARAEEKQRWIDLRVFHPAAKHRWLRMMCGFSPETGDGHLTAGEGSAFGNNFEADPGIP